MRKHFLALIIISAISMLWAAEDWQQNTDYNVGDIVSWAMFNEEQDYSYLAQPYEDSYIPNSKIVIRDKSTNAIIWGEAPITPIGTDPLVRPDGIPTGIDTAVTFKVEIPYDYELAHPIVELIEVSQDGSLGATAGSLRDDGKLSNGDEIMGDGVFTLRKRFNLSDSTTLYFKIKTTYQGATFYSDMLSVNVYKPWTEADIQSVRLVGDSAYAIYKSNVATIGKEGAIAKAVEFLRNQPAVKEVGSSSRGFTVIFQNGYRRGVLCTDPNQRGG